MTDWHKYFRYEPDTGKLYWAITNSNRAPAGREVAAVRNWGYVCVRVNKKTHQAHRIIWDMMHPDDPLLPGEEIDHIDHNRENNIISNLRKISRAENSRNLSKAANNKSGATGVRFDHQRRQWRAEIKVNSKLKFLGRFATFTAAVEARKMAEGMYGFHSNHGRDLA